MFESLKMRSLKQTENTMIKNTSTVSSRDAKLNHLYSKVMEEPSHTHHLELSEELNKRMRADNVFEQFAKGFPVTEMNEEWPSPTKFECLRALMDTYEEHCGKMDDYSLKYVKYLVKECESLPEVFSIHPSMERIKNAC